MRKLAETPSPLVLQLSLRPTRIATQLSMRQCSSLFAAPNPVRLVLPCGTQSLWDRNKQPWIHLFMADLSASATNRGILPTLLNCAELPFAFTHGFSPKTGI